MDILFCKGYAKPFRNEQDKSLATAILPWDVGQDTDRHLSNLCFAPALHEPLRNNEDKAVFGWWVVVSLEVYTTFYSSSDKTAFLVFLLFQHKCQSHNLSLHETHKGINCVKFYFRIHGLHHSKTGLNPCMPMKKLLGIRFHGSQRPGKSWKTWKMNTPSRISISKVAFYKMFPWVCADPKTI